MRRGVTTRVWASIGALAVAGLAGAACDDSVVAPERDALRGPTYHIGDEQPIQMTGGGRIDYPPGTAQKNPGNSRVFQTFGFNVGDKDADGLPEGKLQFVDHTPEHRLNGRPVNLRAVSWHTYRRTVDACADAGIEATGVLEVKNTGERHEFDLWACDNGEPGTRSPHDEFSLDVYYSNGAKRWGWGGKLTGGNLQAHFDGNGGGDGGGGTSPTTGDLTVSAATSGEQLDPDGYTVTVDGGSARSIGIDGSTTYEDVAAGDHSVALSGVAANCEVEGANPRTVNVPAGGTAATEFAVTCSAATGPVTRIAGVGQIGDGIPLPNQNLQTFDLDVASDLTGGIAYTDYSVIRPDGTIATLNVGPADPATSITGFLASSSTCELPERGVEFDGIARLDTGELVEFRVVTCDNGTPGVGVDVFGIFAPSRPYQRGPDRLSGGDLTKTTP